jgi:GMP synthase (glutamine-hydrolysing)
MIIIIDFGSQTTHLISRRLRQIGVENIIITPNEAINEINKNNPKGIILSGGPASVYEKNVPKIDKKIFSLNIPILGICYGLQLTTHLLEGKVIAGKKEYGPETLTIVNQSAIFESLPKNFTTSKVVLLSGCLMAMKW